MSKVHLFLVCGETTIGQDLGGKHHMPDFGVPRVSAWKADLLWCRCLKMCRGIGFFMFLKSKCWNTYWDCSLLLKSLWHILWLQLKVVTILHSNHLSVTRLHTGGWDPSAEFMKA